MQQPTNQHDLRNLTSKLVYSFATALLFIFSCQHKHADPTDRQIATKTINYTDPTVIYLADPPDSLQPEKIFLQDRPNPLIVTIPTRSGGHYILKADGNSERIALKPPSVYSFINTVTKSLIPADLQGAVNFQTAGSGNRTLLLRRTRRR